jgi:hypothetical protein
MAGTRANVSTRCNAPSYIRLSAPLPDSRERIAGFMTVATASAMRCFFAASWSTTNDHSCEFPGFDARVA